MNALTDTRPIVTSEAPIDHAFGVPETFGILVTRLLNQHPRIELATVSLQLRYTPEGKGTVHVAGREGPLVEDGEPACPSCRTHGDHPHTEYCQLSAPCADTEPHAAHLRFDDSPHSVCPGVIRIKLKPRVRANERDAEVDGLVVNGASGKWHQDGPDDAHQREQCEPHVCGWDPLP